MMVQNQCDNIFQNGRSEPSSEELTQAWIEIVQQIENAKLMEKYNG